MRLPTKTIRESCIPSLHESANNLARKSNRWNRLNPHSSLIFRLSASINTRTRKCIRIRNIAMQERVADSLNVDRKASTEGKETSRLVSRTFIGVERFPTRPRIEARNLNRKTNDTNKYRFPAWKADE